MRDNRKITRGVNDRKAPVMSNVEVKNKTKWPGWNEDLVGRLKKSQKLREHFMNDILEEGNFKDFLTALRFVVEATGGVGKLSQKTGLGRQALYRSLTEQGNPGIATVERILEG